MNHIFQKNAIDELETGITRHETIRHDSVCDNMHFRKFIDTFDLNPWFFNPCTLLYKRGFRSLQGLIEQKRTTNKRRGFRYCTLLMY